MHPIKNSRKLLLAYLRSGDYAHAGEEEAIEIAMKSIPKRAQQILDVGCGLGGTAHYLETHGWGKVLGIDVDPGMIAYAQEHYPGITFQCCDVTELAASLQDQRFDVIYSFNAYFSFKDQARALSQLSSVAKPHTQLVLFDYASSEKYREENIFYDHTSPAPKIFAPIDLENIELLLQSTGWQLKNVLDVTPEFDRWYQWLVHRMENQKANLKERFGEPVFEDLYVGFCTLLDLIHSGKVKGAVIYAASALL